MTSSADKSASGGSAAAAGEAKGFGAAEKSLANPACRPGTPEFAAAKADLQKILAMYKDVVGKYEALGNAKPDMKAAKELSDSIRKGLYGHIPGIVVGQEFLGRGQLAVTGLHTQMMSGINATRDATEGAYAICLSGGYKDNDDRGDTFLYTGEGGQEKKKQVRDQEYESVGNAGLLRNYETGTPVRVFRGRAGKPPVYTYEGLYKVVAHTMVKSSDGPKVIQFTMQGVPGHSAVSAKVEFQSLSRSKAFQKIQLAGAQQTKPAERRKVPKNYQWDFQVPSRAAIVRSIKEREAKGEHGRLVNSDISDGEERIPIPLWNAVDACNDVFVPTNLEQTMLVDPEDLMFEYMPDYVFPVPAPDDALQLAEQAERCFQRDCSITCGIHYHGGECPYNEDKLLVSTHGSGVWECDHNCKGSGKGRANLCKRNRVVADGIRYPLEALRVPGKGWGARCAVDLPAGAVLCTYIGFVITDRLAEQQGGADTYLYDLNHFHLYQSAQQEGEADPNRNPLLPHIPTDMQDHHLSIDASHEGNVARFFNHSCDPNCLTQPVFTRNARSELLYYIAIVAAEDIPAFTELTYDYGTDYVVQEPEGEASSPGAGGAPKKRTRCNCGSYNCKGWLKD